MLQDLGILSLLKVPAHMAGLGLTDGNRHPLSRLSLCPQLGQSLLCGWPPRSPLTVFVFVFVFVFAFPMP